MLNPLSCSWRRPARGLTTVLAVIVGCALVATTFILVAVPQAEAAPACTVTVPDSGGNNDVNQTQTDITALITGCDNYGWVADDFDTTGGNTQDVCFAFQEVTMGTYYVVCGTYEPTTGALVPVVVTCEASKIDLGNAKCQGGGTASTDLNVTCSPLTIIAPVFTPDSAGDDATDNEDYEIVCEITHTDPAKSLVNLNVCTKTSASISSNGADCIFSEPPGQLTLVKVVANGTADPSEFTLFADSNSVVGSATGESFPVTPGSFLLTESGGPASYDLAELSCALDATVSVSSPMVTVASGENETCTFTNAISGADLTLVKVVENDMGMVTADQWTLTAAGPDTLTGSMDLTDPTAPVPVTGMVQAGPYELSELADPPVPGYALESIDCGNGPIPLDPGPPIVNIAAGSDVTCTFVNDVLPPAITLTKSPSPAAVNEPGGNVTFTVEITNSGGPGTIDSIVDDPFGDQSGTCVDASNTLLVGQTIDTNETLQCSFTIFVTGPAGSIQTDTVTATVSNPNGSDQAEGDAEVTIIDLPSSISVTKVADPIEIPEPGGPVTFTFTVTNDSAADTVTIDTIDDSIYGDLTDPTLNPTSTCTAPQTLDPVGGATTSYQCTLTVDFMGMPGDSETNVVTFSGLDDDGAPVSNTAQATVTITDVPSAVRVVKSASVMEIDEPGGSVTYTFVVYNDSTVDSVTVTSLVDSKIPDLTDQTVNPSSTCVVPQTLAATDSVDEAGAGPDEYSCSVTVELTGNSGDTHVNIVTAGGTDDDGVPFVEGDDETVTFGNVPSSIEITKTADPVSVDEPGGDVTFTFVIRNTSAVDEVTIISLVDDEYADGVDPINLLVPLAGSTCDSLALAVLQPDDGLDGGFDEVTCQVTRFVAGNAGDPQPYTNEVDVTSIDDDNEMPTDDDTVQVAIDDVASDMEIVKSADPVSVPEPGGDVTYTYTVFNRSTVDEIIVFSLVDDQIDLTDPSVNTDCTVGQTLAPNDNDDTGGSDQFSCTATVYVEGNSTDPALVNVATVQATDDDGNQLERTDDAEVDFDDVPSAIAIAKTPSVSSIDEPGGSVTFDFVVTNLSEADDVTITSLVDSEFGDLNGLGDCVVGTVLEPNDGLDGGPDTYSCSYTTTINGNAGETHTNTVTVQGRDDDGNAPPTYADLEDEATATVDFTDVPSSITMTKTADPTSVPEPGADVTFTFRVDNTSLVDAVTIDELTDTVGAVTVDVTTLPGTTCLASGPVTIAAGGFYECSFTQFIAGDAGFVHENTGTANGTDDDGNDVTASEDEEVTVTDVPPAMTATKTADPPMLDEPDGDVTFSFEVRNDSTAEDLTLTSLLDSIYGDATLMPGSTCTVPQTIAPGATYECEFTTTVEGDAGDVITNVITATGQDNEGTVIQADDDATVTFVDVQGTIEVTKTADPTELPEPGGPVTFTIEVENKSGADTFTLESLDDSVYGNLDGTGTCSVPQTIAPNGIYECSFEADVVGNAGFEHNNVVTALGTDDDGLMLGDSDDATVDVTDVPSSMTVVKEASVDTVPDSGAPVVFTIEIENTSAVDDITVEVIDDSVYGDVSDTCDQSVPVTLAPGETLRCSFTEIVSGDHDDDHRNVVTVDAVDDDGEELEEEDDAEIDILETRLETVKTWVEWIDVDLDTRPSPGDQLRYLIVVTNVGEADLNNITIVDDLTGDSTLCVGPVAPLDTCELETVYELTQPDIDAGRVDNVAVGDSDETPEFPDRVEVDVPRVADISVSKSLAPGGHDDVDGDGGITLGDVLTYLVTVTNEGNVTLDPVLVSDALVDAVDASCVPEAIGPGESCEIEFDYTVQQEDMEAGEIANTAIAVGQAPDGSTVVDDDSLIIDTDRNPSIALVKTAVLATVDPDNVPMVGDTVVFGFELSNDGNVMLDPVVIDDPFPGLTPIECDWAASTDPTTADGALSLGESVACEASYELTQDDIDAGGIENLALGSGDPQTPDDDTDDPVDDSTVELPLLQVPALDVTKSASPAVFNSAGELLTFTLVGTNIGNTTIIDAVMTDELPGLSALDCSWPDAAGVLLPGESVVCTATYETTPQDAAAGEVLNVGLLVGTDPSGDAVGPVNDDADVPYQGPRQECCLLLVEDDPPPPPPEPDEVLGVVEEPTPPLAYTGAESRSLVGVAVALILSGVCFVYGGRRRARDHDEWMAHAD